MADDQVVQIDPFVEYGNSGLKSSGGILQEEFLKDLEGQKAYKAFREMRDNDPVIGAILFAIDMLCRQVTYHVEASPLDTTGEWATFVEGCFHDMATSWQDTLTSIFSFLPFGWAYHEVVYKRRQGPQDELDLAAPASSAYDDGMVGWRKIPLRSQDTLFRWELDEKGGVAGMWQLSPPTYQAVFIPIQKALLFRTTTQKSSPEGRSVLRNAYRPWYYKRRVEDIEGVGIERDLAGLPVMEVPARLFESTSSAADKAVYASLQQLVRNIRRDEQEGILMPQAFDDNGNKQYELKLLTTGGKRQFDTDSIIARYDQRIAMTVLADFILLGHEKVGSFQLGTAKVELFATALTAWLDSVCGVFNSHAIPRLMRLNGVDEKFAPTLEHGDVERADLKELGMYILQLSQAGAPLFPDQDLQDRLREIAGLPIQKQTEEL